MGWVKSAKHDFDFFFFLIGGQGVQGSCNTVTTMRELGYRIDSRKVGELTFVHIAWNSRLVKKEKVARIQRGPGLHRFERSKWQHNPTCLTLLASLLWIFCISFCIAIKDQSGNANKPA